MTSILYRMVTAAMIRRHGSVAMLRAFSDALAQTRNGTSAHSDYQRYHVMVQVDRLRLGIAGLIADEAVPTIVLRRKRDRRHGAPVD